MDDTLLRIRDITKNFPGVRALKGVSFDIKRGTVHGLVGENGAGKSTLIKILSGAYVPEAGTMLLNGSPYAPKNPHQAAEKGISVVHQELKLVETLTIMENIFLGRPQTNRFGLVDWQVMKENARHLLLSLGLSLNPEELVGRLSIAQKQVTEICKALAFRAKVVIMDEPSATLTVNEMNNLYDIIHKMRQEGVTLIYISHRLDEIFEICDVVTVLRDGQHINTLPINQLDRNSLIAMMVGRELGVEYPKIKANIGNSVLSVQNFSMPGVFKNLNFELRRGEILGFAGLVGAGRTEMARALIGADKGARGIILLKGKPYRIHGVKHAVNEGFGFITEDRKEQGLVLSMSIRENISLVNLDNILHWKFISFHKDRKLANKYIHALKIATPGEEAQVKNLSGGNQQKVVISKWLNANCDILIVDEPTRGIDIGAKQEIYRIICRLATEGKSIIMISSDMLELLGICDRIAVMREGHLVNILDTVDANQEAIMDMAII
jgi:ABC-type sugar transport system ATPase subunit